MNGGAGEGGEGSEASAREELRFLIGAARAWLELHRDAGTFGLPSAAEAPDAFADGGDAPRPLASVVPLSPHAARDALGPEPGRDGGAFGPAAPGDVTPHPGRAYGPAAGGAYGPSQGGTYGPAAGGAYGPSQGGAYGPSQGGAYGPAAGDAYGPAAGGAYGASPGAPPAAGEGAYAHEPFVPPEPNAFTPRPGAVTPRPGAVEPSAEAPPGPPAPEGRPAFAAAPADAQSALFSIGVGGAPLRPGVALGVETPADPEARRLRLQTLASEAAGCTRCRLHAGRTKSVFARGNPLARIMFVGEGPGADEDVQGLPFVGKAGQLLDRMVAAMGLAQNEIYVANVVKCRPPQNRKPEPDEMASCMPYLAEQIALIEPEIIIALGGTAAEGILGGRVAITRARGQWRLYRATIPVMPTYHPAYLLRNPPAKREVWADLQAVLQRLGRSVPGKGA
ncbi:MAG TPA: uracil-DNA glycosylase family protein [Polyangiaceae bacterium]|nr:uracil-DNA glycosylase family protein [Polyangiaceae bacterium]